MLKTKIRALIAGAMMATVAGCGDSPTQPEAPSTLVLAQTQSAVVPGTDLRVTATNLATPAEILCAAVFPSPCGQSPHALLRVEVPGGAPEVRGVQVPGPEGAVDRFSYGGYSVRLAGLEPAWTPEATFEKSRYRLVLVVTRE